MEFLQQVPATSAAYATTARPTAGARRHHRRRRQLIFETHETGASSSSRNHMTTPIPFVAARPYPSETTVSDSSRRASHRDCFSFQFVLGCDWLGNRSVFGCEWRFSVFYFGFYADARWRWWWVISVLLVWCSCWDNGVEWKWKEDGLWWCSWKNVGEDESRHNNRVNMFFMVFYVGARWKWWARMNKSDLWMEFMNEFSDLSFLLQGEWKQH